MLAFEVWVNGERLCTASTANTSVLIATLNWVGHAPDPLDFRLGGVDAENREDHLKWNTPTIELGDEITIRIIDAPEGDPPHQRYRPGDDFED